ncbi:MAG: dethiobiotin synthase, partial [Proteobacteria bacterium]|nr:dethiobiotin synthase [Pseudomonadota bacterium]
MTLFVTGTDTGVGKTVVCAALVSALKGRGIEAGYMKPLASGCLRQGGELVSTDAEFVRSFCGLDDPPELICPVRLEAPLAPLAAARAQGAAIDLRPVYAAWRRLKQQKDILVVEGVGGLLVPISDTLSVASLVSDWGVPCLVVARSSLGTINHT